MKNELLLALGTIYTLNTGDLRNGRTLKIENTIEATKLAIKQSFSEFDLLFEQKPDKLNTDTDDYGSGSSLRAAYVLTSTTHEK